MGVSPAAFAWVSALARKESAIVLETGKEYLVDSRLQPLARAGGHAGVEEYVAHVRARGGADDRAAIVEAMTTNETSFFRDRDPFDALVTTVIPALLASNAATRTIRVWSAACSSGQEAYTIAMLMAEHVLPLGWQVEIFCTDLSHAMVERTREGRYSQLEIGRGLPAAMLVRHFRKVGTSWQVSDQLRAMVRAEQMNLVAPFPLLPRFDVVFLRNVLIYFDSADKRSVLSRVRRVMSPTGFLVLGAAETTLGVDDAWTRINLGRFSLHTLPGPAVAPVTERPLAAAAESG